MNQLTQNTALLLFSYSAEEENGRKQLVNEEVNLTFLNLLYNRTNSVLENSSLPVFKYSKTNQKGDTFGERIGHAFEQVFEEGFDRVICVGSDCPELEVSDIQKASDELNSSDIVLGPDFRGGFFLIGLNKEAFDESAFKRLNWQQAGLLKSFLRYSLPYSLHFLEAKFDLNVKNDIVSYAPKSKVLAKILKIVFVDKRHDQPFAESRKIKNLIVTDKLRGPPSRV